MMKEKVIKFRGKSLSTKEWIYGCYVNNGGEEYIIPEDPQGIINYEDYQVDGNTVSQFTGFYDKNGKEIYEDKEIVESSFLYKLSWNFATVSLITLGITIIIAITVLGLKVNQFLGIMGFNLSTGLIITIASYIKKWLDK